MAASETLTARAALWAWLARAVTYPTEKVIDALADPPARARLEASAGLADPGGTLGCALNGVWTALDDQGGQHISLSEEHTFLFGRHVRVSPYESSYVLAPGTDRSSHLAEIGGFYAAFGLQISPDHPEMPDHVGAECELAAVLLAKRHTRWLAGGRRGPG